MRRDPRSYLWDALRAADLIVEFVRGRTLVDYESDVLLRSAVERQFVIVGEALSQLSRADAELAGRVPELGEIIGFRNILVHGYAIVDDEQVWHTIDDLVALRAALRGLIDD